MTDARRRSQRALAPRRTSLEHARGYDRDDLFVIAEIAHGYLFSGNARLALQFYEGLNAIAPDEGYFALSLAVAHEELGDQKQAARWYQEACRLDPKDARARINLGQLLLRAGSRRKAARCFSDGLSLARRSGEQALEKKARAILEYLEIRS